jgi:phage gp46-like protein
VAIVPDTRLKQSARFPRGTVQVSIPDVFADWAAPGWVETPEAGPLAPSYEVTLDWRVSDGVVDETQALATAIMVALGSDRLADVRDELPDNLDNDRRGWWGDMDAEEVWNGWPLGTRLWEMRRDAVRGEGYRFGATTVKADNFVRECMRPFVETGIVSKFDVTVEQVTDERIDVLIVIYRNLAPAVSLRFAYLWDSIGRTQTRNSFA